MGANRHPLFRREAIAERTLMGATSIGPGRVGHELAGISTRVPQPCDARYRFNNSIRKIPVGREKDPGVDRDPPPNGAQLPWEWFEE